MQGVDNAVFSRKCYYICIGLCAVVGICWFTVWFFHIDIRKLLPPCSLYSLTGLYCPGCGGTRALVLFFQGHFIQSFLHHPVIVYAAFLLIPFMVSHTLSILTRNRIKGFLFRPIYFYIMIGVIIVQCIVKNVLLVAYDIHII